MNVSAYSKSTTASMVKNYLIDQGGAANAFAKFARSELVVVDVGVDADISTIPGLVDRKIARGTKNFTKGPAMTRAQAKQSIKIGKDLANKAIKAGCNCFLLGEMGISNTTSAAAMTSALLQINPRKVTGRGSNISDEKLKNKIKIIKQALEINKPNPDDAIDVLAKVGGFEFGAMAGVILAAAKKKCVVILDGFNTTVAALIADAINPSVREHLIASHIGREIGHEKALDFLHLFPMFKLDLALSEAVGSSIAAKVLDSIVYTWVCGPDDDFEGDLSDFKADDDMDGAEVISSLLEKIGLPDAAQFENFDDIENYFEEKFGENLQIEEVDVDFQLSTESRLESFPPPFSAQDFNIPRSYPMMIRAMGGVNDDPVAATDKTFNFYLQTMPKLHYKAMDACKEYIDSLTKPKNSLGLLEDIAIQFAGITNENIPANSLRHAALAFTDMENKPSSSSEVFRPIERGKRRNVSMDYSMTARTFGVRVFVGFIDSKQDPTVAFSFGRNLAEEITFSIPIITFAALADWRFDELDEKFAAKLLTEEGELKVPAEEFLNHVPKKYRCLTSALIGAMVAAAHNSTLIVLDCGIVEIIARYLEKICPEIKPFLLYTTKLVNFDFRSGRKIGFDGEISCIGIEIVEAALTALNEMKTFDETKVDVAIDGGK